ncbi:TIGR03086 family protein [Actinoplanes sp. TBRC 11911]|uniref:TIGR03086 family metal-binding protein n=1 Tax=Actinoplanes sp. TBRC 11911 TaxID=2729386 RepID=UPI00145C7B8A|nr:TIGR03086 family metal-binding protein [Actinoplanes sp. TBRC 11911]NMO57103.1 TIGR03086 family protein [Actinoplanes sp. TBRC 11911]
METQISTLLTAAAARTVPVIRGIRDDQLGHPTPCEDFRVRELFNHLYQNVGNFTELAARKEPDSTTTPDEITGDWRTRFAEQTERLVEAWSDPAALEGTSPASGMPQEMVGGLALLELTVHGWDVARATGQRYTPDPAAVALLIPLFEQVGQVGRDLGLYGEVIEVGAEAGDFARLLGLTGRQTVL